MVTGVRDHGSPYFTQIFVKDRPGLLFANASSRQVSVIFVLRILASWHRALTRCTCFFMQEFEISRMGRDCCMVSGSLHGEAISISTAHFESLSQYSDERKQQFSW